MRILFFGDSITAGYGHGSWATKINDEYADRIEEWCLSGRDYPECYNLGVDGDKTDSLLKRVDSETAARDWESRGNLAVVIMIGTNDTVVEKGERRNSPEQVQDNLDKIIGQIKPRVKEVVLIGVPALDESRSQPVYWNDGLYFYNTEVQKSEIAARKVADKYDIQFVPVFDEFKKHLDAGEDLLIDGVHPNSNGHELIKNLVLPKIMHLLEIV